MNIFNALFSRWDGWGKADRLCPSHPCVPLIVCAALSSCFFAGCDNVSNEEIKQLSRQEQHREEERKFDDFEEAIELLNRADEYDQTQVDQIILLHLSKWIDKQRPDVDWIIDPMFNRLPGRFDGLRSAAGLQGMTFAPFDVPQLKEAVWLRDIARAAAGRATEDPEMAAWLAEESQNLSRDEADDLAIAERLFDWTVRNLQLDADPDDDAAVEVAAGTDREGNPLPPIPKPPRGTKYSVGESLLLGHAHALVRAQVFLLLLRQQGIEGAMLVIDDENAGGLKPWLPAALIGDRLYLFDTVWGVPLPGPGGRGIATLEQIRTDPQIFSQLDMPNRPYRIRRRELDDIVALIEAAPPALSQRMLLIEKQLSGDRALTLTVAPTELAQRLGKVPGVNDVRLWTLVYDMYLYHGALNEWANRAARIPETFIDRQKELQTVMTRTPLASGRILQFRGETEGDLLDRGAKAFYLRCLVPNASLDQFMSSPELQKAFGLNPELLAQLPPSDRANVLEHTRNMISNMKYAAAYWLGVISFERGDYDVAIDYLNRRIVEGNAGGRWENGARYLLGRTYEAMGRRDNDPELLRKAIEFYRWPQSPQADGNEWRALRLEKLL